MAWDDRVACWWSVTPRSVGQADQYIVMISADFESFVACELSDGVHHVWWNCSNKLKCCVFGCLKKAALDNFTHWCSTRPVSLVAVKIFVTSQLEAVITFILDSADLSWPVTFVVEPVVSTVYDFRYISAFIIWLWWHYNIFAVGTAESWWTAAYKCLGIDITTA